MEFVDHGGDIEIIEVSDFDLVKTFESGQCFRWNSDKNGIYTGVAQARAVRLRQAGTSIHISCSIEDFDNIWRDYFDLDRDYIGIRRFLCIDDFMRSATDFGAGIRILRQDSWEALCSFIISQRNNIPRIKKIIIALCEEFGDRFEFDGETFYSFPSAQRLAPLNETSLAPLRCGYRASYIIGAARSVAEGTLDLDTLSRSSLQAARETLKTLYGVGDKVADCTILFGLNILDAFPLDVWMKRAIAEYYGQGFDPVIFSPYAGIAQQYIYYYIRNLNKNAKKLLL